jgi:hypothetical protein
LKCVPATFVVVEKKNNKSYIFWVCVCSLRYRACNACAILSSVACRALKYFCPFSHKRQDFPGKGVEYNVCVWIISTNVVWNISNSNKNWEMYDQNFILVFMLSVCHVSQILMKLEFSRQIFEKYSNITFHESSSIGKRVFPWVRLDELTNRYAAKRLFSQLCKKRLKLDRNLLPQDQF